MSQTFEDYCGKLQKEVDALSHEASPNSSFCLDHRHAFNFGRIVGRMENARPAFWYRVRWLLLGAAVGLAFAAACLDIFLMERVVRLGK